MGGRAVHVTNNVAVYDFRKDKAAVGKEFYTCVKGAWKIVKLLSMHKDDNQVEVQLPSGESIRLWYPEFDVAYPKD